MSVETPKTPNRGRPSKAALAAEREKAEAAEPEIVPETQEELVARIEAEVRQKLVREQAEQAAIEAETAANERGSEVRKITVHFVNDGFTLLGQIWYRGQELTIVEGTREWELAKLPDGSSILDYDVYDQEAHYGTEHWRPGPWRGKPLDTTDSQLTKEQKAALLRENARVSPVAQPVPSNSLPAYLEPN